MRQEDNPELTSPPRKVTRKSLPAKTQLKSRICFFCEEMGYFQEDGLQLPQGLLPLHRVTTVNRDTMIRKCATEMKNEKLIIKLSEGDMISKDSCYHHKCMTTFTNAYRKFINSKCKTNKDKQKDLEEIALLESVEHIEEILQTSLLVASYVKLPDVRRYYCDVLESLNAEFVSVNATRQRLKCH